MGLFKDYLPRYEEISLKIYPRSFVPFSFTYYAVGIVVRKISRLDEEEMAKFVAVSFLDTFFDVGLYTYAGRDVRNRFIKRPVVTLDMMIGRCGTLTHYNPQLVLGFKETWNERDLEVLREIVREYCAEVSDFLLHKKGRGFTNKFFKDLYQDEDVKLHLKDKTDLVFYGIGLKIAPETWQVFKEEYERILKLI